MPILFVSFGIHDADQDRGGAGFEFVPDNPISSDDLLSVAEAVWQLVLPLMNGTRVSMNISTGVRIYSDPPAEDISDVQEAANFMFFDVDGNHSETGISCFREEFFLGSGAEKNVDLTAAPVLAFITAMTQGIDIGGGNTLRHVTEHGTVVNRLGHAQQAWRPRKKKRRAPWR